MDLEPTMLGLFKRERERGKFLARAEPNKPAFADGNIGLEYGRMNGPDFAVHPIGRDHKIGIGKQRRRVDFRLKVLLYPQRKSSLLEDVEQPPSTDSAKTMAVGTNRLAPKMHVNGVPVIKILN